MRPGAWPDTCRKQARPPRTRRRPAASTTPQDRREGEEVSHHVRQGQAQADAEQAAQARQRHRLDQELPGNVAALGTQGAADADLAGALGHRRQHDVHDADAAHHQRDRGDGPEHQREDLLRLLGLLQQVQRHRDLEVLARVELLQRAADQLGRALDVLHPVHLDRHLADLELLER